MTARNLTGLLVTVAAGVLATACSAGSGESTGQQSDDILSRYSQYRWPGSKTIVTAPSDSTTTKTPTATTPETAYAWRCGTIDKQAVKCADGLVCKDLRDPEMVHLINLALANPPVPGREGAFVYNGGVTLASSTPRDEDALTHIRKKYNDAMGSDSFDGNFMNFVKRLWDSAEPAFEDSTCGVGTPYFMINYAPTEDEDLGRQQMFIQWSQAKYLPSHECSRKQTAGHTRPLPALPPETRCAFVDPWWGTEGNTTELSTLDPALLMPQVAGGVPGKNWVSSGKIIVNQDPDWTPPDSMPRFTVYRAFGVPLMMLKSDLAAYQIEYGGAALGTWLARVPDVCAGGGACTVSSGSRATFELVFRLY